MTEKRFIIDVLDENNWLIQDTKTGEYANPIDGTINVLKGLISTLNKFNDENKQLKEALIELKEIGDYQYTRIKELSDENDELEQTNQRLTIALKEIKEKTNIYLEMTKKGEDQP